MKVLKGENDVGRVKRREFKFDPPTMNDVKVELAPDTVVKDEVQSLWVLKSVSELHDKWVPCTL